MSLPSNIRVNMPVSFPALVNGTDIVKVTKSNGIWSIGGNFTGLTDLPVSLGSAILVAYDPVAKTYYKVTASNLVNFAFVGGIFTSQIRQGLRAIDVAARRVVSDNIPDDPYDPLNICWNATFAKIGDALYTAIKARLFGNNDASTVAFYAQCGALPVTPT